MIISLNPRLINFSWGFFVILFIGVEFICFPFSGIIQDINGNIFERPLVKNDIVVEVGLPAKIKFQSIAVKTHSK
ncbi:MAG: hypothetical protein EOO98_04650 [Pedobacter sp.]|nr:MAG: hypothetical protein EOO98_04650 [Pedobacter sp.]